MEALSASQAPHTHSLQNPITLVGAIATVQQYVREHASKPLAYSVSRMKQRSSSSKLLPREKEGRKEGEMEREKAGYCISGPRQLALCMHAWGFSFLLSLAEAVGVQ